MPGVAKEDIAVDVDEKSVRVEATFKRETGEGENVVLTGGRVTGAVSRAHSSCRKRWMPIRPAQSMSTAC